MHARRFRFEYLPIAAALVVIGMTRLPFLANGYGLDPDAWRVANAARLISQTGTYAASRLPGYPVQEITCSFFWQWGPIALNGLTALMSVLAVLFLMLILRHYGARLTDAILAGFALAFTPLFFLNSLCSMDYVWAVAFILGAWYVAVRQMPLLAGVLLGIATGCRITSLAMILPLAILLVNVKNFKLSAQRCGWLSVGAVVGTALCFWPVWDCYGMGFWSHAVPKYYPSRDDLYASFTV